MDWNTERRKLQVKHDRGHFGLVWSVLTAYAIAIAILLVAWHPRTRDMINFRFVAIIVFMVVGACGVYLSLAVAMRWSPHNALKPDAGKLEKIEPIFSEGRNLFQKWGSATAQRSRIPDGLIRPDAAALNRSSTDFSNKLINWIETSEKDVDSILGTELGTRYKMSPDLSEPEPVWATSSDRVGLYQDVLCRLSWLRTWSQDQFEL